VESLEKWEGLEQAKDEVPRGGGFRPEWSIRLAEHQNAIIDRVNAIDDKLRILLERLDDLEYWRRERLWRHEQTAEKPETGG